MTTKLIISLAIFLAIGFMIYNKRSISDYVNKLALKQQHKQILKNKEINKKFGKKFNELKEKVKKFFDPDDPFAY